jgi:hypothetical protein
MRYPINCSYKPDSNRESVTKRVELAPVDPRRLTNAAIRPLGTDPTLSL